jgi:hypothetical protein
VLSFPVVIVAVDLLVLPEAATAGSGRAEFVLAGVMIALLAVACVAVVAWLLRDVDLDPPPAATAGTIAA